jgi:hypothetical protein
MMISRHIVAEKLAAYLRHTITLPELVEWAETAMMDGDFDEADLAEIRDAVARLGLADVRAFGLTWEDCEHLLQKLGYTARIDIVAA